MTIRLAERGDILQIIAFDHIARSERGTARKDFITRSVLKKRCYVAVVESTDKPVGYAVLEYTFFENGFISMLYIHADWRRKGIGSALIRHVEERCKTEKLFTSTNQSNEPMQRLLEKLRYERSGIIHNVDPMDPELIYFKALKLSDISDNIRQDTHY